jgi:hypothetical protein
METLQRRVYWEVEVVTIGGGDRAGNFDVGLLLIWEKSGGGAA